MQMNEWIDNIVTSEGRERRQEWPVLPTLLMQLRRQETGDRRQEVGQDRSPALTGLHSKKYRQCFVPEQWINFLLTNKTLCL